MNAKWFLGGVFVFFVAILVAVAVLSERARPVLLDAQGRPVNGSSGGHHH